MMHQNGFLEIFRESGIHNPKPRKFSTLITKTGCSYSGFMGFLMFLYASISPPRAFI
jgi:hypothetical protein